MRRLSVSLTAVLLAAAGGSAPATADPPGDAVARTAPVPGSVGFGARAADPLGGAEWAVRVWRPKDSRGFGSGSHCLQVGRVAGEGLDRPLGAGARALEPGDRTICGIVDRHSSRVVLVERLVEDPAAADPKPVRTVLAGLAPRRARRVVVEVRGRLRGLPVRGGTFLAVLPGDVRRADLVVRFGKERLDFARGDAYTRVEAPVPGTVRVVLRQPDPEGGPPLALLTYRTPEGERCGEPVRLLGGEAGHYQRDWGSFADAPTLAELPSFEDHWAPSGSTPAYLDSCTSGHPASLIEGLGARRLSWSQVVVHGLLRRDAVGPEVLDPSGRPVAVARGAGAFLAAVPSRGTFGEHLGLTVTRGDGRRFTRGIPLGDHAGPATFESYAVRDGGRILRIRWTGGSSPFHRVDVVEHRDRVLVTVFERRSPLFEPNGMSFDEPAVGIGRCVDVELAHRLGARTVRDGAAAGRRRPRMPLPSGSRDPRCEAWTPPAS